MAPVATFKALGDPTRQRIIALLADEDMTIGQVVDHFDMTRAGVKKHMRLLEEGGLISVTPDGRERVNSLNRTGLKEIEAWLQYFDQFWDDKLDALSDIIQKEHIK